MALQNSVNDIAMQVCRVSELLEINTHYYY